MPGRIIALYVLLIVRVLANGAGIVKSFPSSNDIARIGGTFSVLEFGFSLFILIALYFKKPWTISLFRAYMAIAIPLSLYFMWLGATAAAQMGRAFAWHPFYGATFAAAFFLWFAWYVGQSPTPDYLAGRWRDTTPP